MSLIHRYQSNGYNIVLDINSGCIHLVDQVTYEVLPFMEEGLTETEIVDRLKEHFSAEDISTSVRECEKLRNDGMLFTRDAYENVIEEFTKNRQTVVKALCLHIAHDCNLACRYCFAEEGEYHGRRALMSYEVGKKATLNQAMEGQDFIEYVKDKFHLQHLKYSKNTNKMIHTIAICGGSAADDLEILTGQVDCYITGDTKYRHAKYAIDHDCLLIDPGHHLEVIIEEKLPELLEDLPIQIQIHESIDYFKYE